MFKHLKELYDYNELLYTLLKPYRLYIRNPLDQLIKAVQWYWNVLRKDHDWDGAYIYPIIEYKLKRIRYALENGYAHQEPKDMKALSLAIKLSNRLSKEQYAFRSYNKHDRKWGGLEMISRPAEGKIGYYNVLFNRPNAVTDSEKLQEKAELQAIYQLEQKLMDRDERLLFDIIRKYRHRWWV